MAGVGDIMDMVRKMKPDRGLARKAQYRELKKMYLKDWNASLTSSSKPSQEQLELIKKRIKKRQLKINAIRAVVFILTISVLIVLFMLVPNMR